MLPGVAWESVQKDETLIVECRSEVIVNLYSVTCTCAFRVPFFTLDSLLFCCNDAV